MSKAQTHPAALTSKNLLANALVSLLHQKSYESLTITEICLHAQVARRTFYRNFDSLDDVLDFYITSIMCDFKSHMQAHAADTYPNILITFFTFWKYHADTLYLLNTRNLYNLMFMKYIKLLPEMPFLFKHVANAILDKKLFVPTMAFNAGGLWSLLTYWICSNCEQTPEELAHIVLLH